METVVLVIHLLLVTALIGVVLVQRSEGGALGIGGGGNFMSTRGTGNALTRATTILAALFFITSIGLTLLARTNNEAGGVFQNLPTDTLPADATGEPAGGVLNLLGGGAATVPADAGGAVAPADGAVVPADAGGTPAAATDTGTTAPPVPADAGAGAPAASGTTTPVVPADAGSAAPATTP